MKFTDLYYLQVVLRYLVFTVFLIGNVNSFPYGVPNRPYVCQEMFPIGHGSNAQFSDPPFEINLSQNIYSEGQEEFRGNFDYCFINYDYLM